MTRGAAVAAADVDPVEPAAGFPLPDWRTLARRVLPGLVGALIVVAALGYFFREPIGAFATGLVARWGALGVVLGALLLDLVPGPGNPPVVFVAYTGGEPWWLVVLLVGTGGLGATVVGWAAGRLLGRIPALRRRLERSGLPALLHTHGARGVFVAGLIPMPYVLTTLAAGATGLRLGPTVLGGTARYVKALLNVALVALGWGLAR